MKGTITPPIFTTNNIQQLDDVVVGQATSLKILFDKTGDDAKNYIVNTLIPELNGNTGSNKIGHLSSGVSADNVGDAIQELAVEKLDQGGNFTGTWKGYSPVASDPGIQAIVNEHTNQINKLENATIKDIYNSAISDGIVKVSSESLTQLRTALLSGTVKIAFVGDSITEGYDQTNLKDNYVERFMRSLKEKFPSVTIEYTNFALTGRTLENFVSPTFKDYSLVGNDLCQTRTWITDVNKVWREYVKDYQPDLLFIAFGVNDSIVTKPNGQFIDKYFHGNLDFFKTSILTTYAKQPSVCLITSLLGTTVEADAISVFGYMPSEMVTQSVARITREYAKNTGYVLADANRLWLLARDGKDDVRRVSVWERDFEKFDTSDWTGDKSDYTLSSGSLTQNAVGKYVSRIKPFYEGYVSMDIAPRLYGSNGVLYVIVRNDVDLGGLLWNIKPSSSLNANDGNIILYRQNANLTYDSLSVSANTIINVDVAYNFKFESIGAKHTCYLNGVKILEFTHYGNMHDGFVTLGSPNTAPTISNFYISYSDSAQGNTVATNAELIGVPPYDDHSTSGDGLHHPTGLGHAIAYEPSLWGIIEKAKKLESVTIPTQESWTAPTLLNGWVNFGGTEETAGYFKDSFGIVHLKGSIKSGTATSGTILFTLPVGYRPSLTKMFSAVSNSAFGAMGVQYNGNVVIVSGANVVFSFDGVTFKV